MQAAVLRLRRSRFMKAGAVGLVVRYEGHGSVTEGPHEHVHFLAVGGPLDPARLRLAWQRAARTDKAAVEVDVVPPKEIRNVLAYLSKPLDDAPDAIVERAIAFRGKHDLVLLGALRRRTESIGSPKAERTARQYVVVETPQLEALASGGCEWARVALGALRRVRT